MSESLGNMFQHPFQNSNKVYSRASQTHTIASKQIRNNLSKMETL